MFDFNDVIQILVMTMIFFNIIFIRYIIEFSQGL